MNEGFNTVSTVERVLKAWLIGACTSGGGADVTSTFSAAILACRSCWNREEDDCWDREDRPEHGMWVGATVVDMID
jgi:hypothetical protein